MNIMAVIIKFWKSYEIQVLVMGSLFLQIFLLCGATIRRYDGWRHMFLWFAYLLADIVATTALGHLTQIGGSHLVAFWAPFLLLHLGGQDNITAYSLEDNELWKRHLLDLISQGALAFYVSIKSLWYNQRLLVPTILMFVVGLVKYTERIFALKRASRSDMRNQMLTKPDPGPNYAKFMEEFDSSVEAGLPAKIYTVDESSADIENQQAVELPRTYFEVVLRAYKFFQMFKRLFVDLILSFEDRKESKDLFVKFSNDYNKAYKVIEIELFFMHEILHSKAAILYSSTYGYIYGYLSRVGTLICSSLALYFFCSSNKHNYESLVVSPKKQDHTVDVAVTYVLLCGAVLLEIVAVISMLLSFWTFVALEKLPRLDKVANRLFDITQKYLRPENKPLWSNQIAQFDLIQYSLHKDDKHYFHKVVECIVTPFGLKDDWEKYSHTNYTPVDDELKRRVFTELMKTMNSTGNNANRNRSFSNHRGKWALDKHNHCHEIGWSVDAEFDESILLWHIATYLLFDNANSTPLSEICQTISKYMLYLLVWCTSVLPPGIGLIRFRDTCAEVEYFLKGEKDKRKAAEMILAVKTSKDPKVVKGDRSKSVLFYGCRLAQQLKEVKELQDEEKWELIAAVWIEMLCFAASKCQGHYHASLLSKGGELLTVVWLLMVHLGIGEQYRIEAGHARAKLIVPK